MSNSPSAARNDSEHRDYRGSPTTPASAPPILILECHQAAIALAGRAADSPRTRRPKAKRPAPRRRKHAPTATLWPALLDGHYTIVDRCELAGKQLLIARHNPATTAQQLRLAPLERRIIEATCAGTLLKVIALELGWSQPRVSRTLRRALHSLGLRSAYELTCAAASVQLHTLTCKSLATSSHSAFALAGPRGDCLAVLTVSEREVAVELLRGLSNREIAVRRGRSERTVANQVARILGKLGVATRRALIVRVARRDVAAMAESEPYEC